MTDPPAASERPCSGCGTPRAACRTPDQPFLSCCEACRRSDGDTHYHAIGDLP